MDRQTVDILWDEYDIGSATLNVPLFGRDITFEFLTEATPPKVSPKMWQAVEHVLALKEADIEKVAALLWEEAVFAFTVADYGVKARAGESHLDAHLRSFEISSAEDALNKCEIRAVQLMQENDKFDGIYAEIQIITATDNSISIIVKDGQIVDYDDDGCWLGGFDDNPRQAHDARAKVLAS